MVLNPDVFSVEGRTAFVIPPVQRTPGAKTPWIWYAPTLPAHPDEAERWMFERFLAAGLAITGIDVGESFGSPAGRALYTALHEELVSARNFAGKACLLARSRGGLMLYNWAAEHASSVACIAGIYPVCDLRSYPGLDRACGAFGLTEDALERELSRHNPIDRLKPLAEARVPIFHIHGDDDTAVPLQENSGELARRYRRLGGKIELVVAQGQEHNMWPGFFQCQELVDFVIANAPSDPVVAR